MESLIFGLLCAMGVMWWLWSHERTRRIRAEQLSYSYRELIEQMNSERQHRGGLNFSTILLVFIVAVLLFAAVSNL